MHSQTSSNTKEVKPKSRQPETPCTTPSLQSTTQRAATQTQLSCSVPGSALKASNNSGEKPLWKPAGREKLKEQVTNPIPVPLGCHHSVHPQEVRRAQQCPQVHGVLDLLQHQPNQLSVWTLFISHVGPFSFLQSLEMQRTGLQTNPLVDPTFAKSIQLSPLNVMHRDSLGHGLKHKLTHNKPLRAAALLEEQPEQVPSRLQQGHGTRCDPKYDLRAFNPLDDHSLSFQPLPHLGEVALPQAPRLPAGRSSPLGPPLVRLVRGLRPLLRGQALSGVRHPSSHLRAGCAGELTATVPASSFFGCRGDARRPPRPRGAVPPAPPPAAGAG